MGSSELTQGILATRTPLQGHSQGPLDTGNPGSLREWLPAIRANILGGVDMQTVNINAIFLDKTPNPIVLCFDNRFVSVLTPIRTFLLAELIVPVDYTV